jgi:hypothetical protein
MATIFFTSRFVLFAMLIFEFLFYVSVQVSPSVQNENSVSVVIKKLWMKAPLKPVGESPSFNTWLIRPSLLGEKYNPSTRTQQNAVGESPTKTNVGGKTTNNPTPAGEQSP